MGLGFSLFLVAVGAILRFAVGADADGVNLQTVGLILMIVGAVGVVLSLIFWTSWGGFHRSESVTTRTGTEPGGRPVVEQQVTEERYN